MHFSSLHHFLEVLNLSELLHKCRNNNQYNKLNYFLSHSRILYFSRILIRAKIRSLHNLKGHKDKAIYFNKINKQDRILFLAGMTNKNLCLVALLSRRLVASHCLEVIQIKQLVQEINKIKQYKVSLQIRFLVKINNKLIAIQDLELRVSNILNKINIIKYENIIQARYLEVNNKNSNLNNYLHLNNKHNKIYFNQILK